MTKNLDELRREAEKDPENSEAREIFLAALRRERPLTCSWCGSTKIVQLYSTNLNDTTYYIDSHNPNSLNKMCCSLCGLLVESFPIQPIRNPLYIDFDRFERDYLKQYSETIDIYSEYICYVSPYEIHGFINLRRRGWPRGGEDPAFIIGVGFNPRYNSEATLLSRLTLLYIQWSRIEGYAFEEEITRACILINRHMGSYGHSSELPDYMSGFLQEATPVIHRHYMALNPRVLQVRARLNPNEP